MNSMGSGRNNTGGNLRNSSTGGDRIPKGYNVGQLQNFDRRQTGLYNSMFDQVNPDSYMARLAGGDKGIFDEIEAPQHRQFSEQLGQISSRFSGAGTGGRHSSGFQNQNTAAASNFSQDLASKRHSMQQDAIKSLWGMSGDLLGQKPTDRFLVEKPQKNSGWNDFLGSLGGAIPSAAAGFASGGPYGTATGGLSSFLSSLFGKKQSNQSPNLTRNYPGM